MKKTGKILAIVLAFALTVGLTAAVTVALLTDETETAHNVMVAGNVYIEQHEYERKLDANGLPTDELQEFTQNKPWLPVTQDIDWDQSGYQSWDQVGAPGSNQLFEKALGVQDKFIFVENTGSVNAYYRTLVAVEMPEGTDDLVHININGNERFVTYESFTEIAGVRYQLFEFVYKPELTPDEVSRPSLLQVYLDKAADNEQIDLFNGQLDILAMSQAVQSYGFADAESALDEAFGDVTPELAAQWLRQGLNPTAVEDGTKATLKNAIENAQPGDIIVLTEDTNITGYAATEKLIIEKPVTIDLNGKTLTTESGWGGIELKNGASLVNGVINHTGNTAAIKVFDADTISNVTINVTETSGKVKGGIVIQAGDSHINSIRNVTINGVSNGIECYNNSAEVAIGSISNVTINATQNGIYLNGGGVIGSMSNVDITAGDTGIRGDLKNLWHIGLSLSDCTVQGGKYGVDIWDESPANTGSTVTLSHENSTFTGGTHGIKITLGEEVACTYQGQKQQTPVELYVD